MIYRGLLIRTLVVVAAGVLPLTVARAGWLDWLTPKSETSQTSAPPAKASALPAAAPALAQDEIVRGLKEALSKGAQQAISQLGKDGGFLNNLDVKIPMPERLQTVEKTLRTLKQDKVADEFVATMNHAAEKAVPEAAAIFGTAISKMTLDDARGILKGPDDAATQYFRKACDAQLTERFEPIVKQATAKVGVTAAYKQLVEKAGPVGQFLGQDAGDLDGYITRRTLDGLFKMIAVQEKQIRQNPVARTTDLLQKVFGARNP